MPSQLIILVGPGNVVSCKWAILWHNACAAHCWPLPRSFASALKMVANVAHLGVWVVKSTPFPHHPIGLCLFASAHDQFKIISGNHNSMAGFTCIPADVLFTPGSQWNICLLQCCSAVCIASLCSWCPSAFGLLFPICWDCVLCASLQLTFLCLF